MTSRPYQHITRQFNRRLGSQKMPLIHLQGDSEGEAHAIAQEIQLVVDSRIHETAESFCLESNERQLLKKQFETVPNRTYLWVTLVFDGLMESILDIDQRGILGLTKALPQSVYDAYEKILNRNPELEKLRRRALHIILSAKRPLSLAEMSIALALNDSNDQQSRASLAKNIMPVGRIRAYLRDLCGLFVIIVDENVYLLHQTARDFLIYIETQDKTEQSALSDNIYKQDDGTRSYIWKHSMNPMDSNSVFAKACILYLHLDFAKEDISLLESTLLFTG